MIKHFYKSIEKKIDKDNLNENKISAEITYKYELRNKRYKINV